MKTNLIITFLFSLLTTISYAQNDLETWFDHGKQKYNSGEWKESLSSFKKALVISDATPDLEERVPILKYINGCYNKLGLYDSAVYYTIQTIETAKQLENDTLLGDAYYNQGLNYKKLTNYKLTKIYYIDALKIFERLHSVANRAKIYNSLGNLEREFGSFEKSIEYHEKAIEIRSVINDPYEISKSYHNIGQTYVKHELFEQARTYFFKAIVFREYVEKSTSKIYNQIGLTYLRENKSDSAYFYLNKSLTQRKSEGNFIMLLTSFKNLGEYYLNLEDYKQSEAYLDSAYQIADTIKKIDELAEVVLLQIKLEKRKSPELQIIEKYDEFIRLNDSLYMEQSKKDLISLSLEYNVIEYKKTIDYQTDEIALQEAENEALKWRNFVLFFGGSTAIIFVIVLILFGIRLRKRKKETEEKNDELEKSKSLIESLHDELSHRTGNYYEMFRALFKYDRKHIDDPKMIRLLNNYINRVNAMSQIQRYLLESDTKTREVRLDLYLTNLLNSIDSALNNKNVRVKIIEQFETISFDYDKALRLGLVMNEVMSNAFEHGLINIEKPKLEVTLTLDKERLIFLTIRDNGVGIKDLEKFKTSSKGIGLIEMILKNENGKIVFESEIGKGTVVSITIPK